MKKNKNEEVELSDVQKEILIRRKRINRRALEEEKVEPFSRYKIITYIFIFLFTPYGLYRLLKKDSPFKKGEKIVYSFVSVVYLMALYSAFNQLF